MAGRERRLFPLVVAVYVLGLHLLCGVLTLPSVVQPVLGLKVFFTFLFGMAAFGALAEGAQLLQAGAGRVHRQPCGVALDVLIDFPWAGEAYESALATVQVSREWSSGGIPRLAGFARASFDGDHRARVERSAARQSMERSVPRDAVGNRVRDDLADDLQRARCWRWRRLRCGQCWKATQRLKRLILPWIAGFASICLALPIAATQFGLAFAAARWRAG